MAASKNAHGVLHRVVAQLERFFRIEAVSGILLLIAAVIALAWASSPLSPLYEALHRRLHFVIDDVLMVFFFFLAGIEIKRELHQGSLSTVRRALLPIAAAAFGMIVPALVYFGFHAGTPAVRGWAIPMATDIAFAVGVISLLGKRVPRQVRVLLLALAVVDDLGAILVIAVFYSSSVGIPGLALAAIGVGGVLVLRDVVPRWPIVFLAPGVLVWYGVWTAGVHPTIAGVAVALLVPADSTRVTGDGDGHRSSVLERIEHAIHPWVAFGIMPLFALANAGVDLRRVALGQAPSARVMVAVFIALVVGKPMGIAFGTWAGVRLGGELPRVVTWRAIAVVGTAGGIGFTMSIFVAGLAFGSGPLLGPAKLGVLLASLASGVGALLLGITLLREPSAARS